MIDYQSKIYTFVATSIKAAHPDTKVSSEYTRSRSETKCVTCEEIENTDVQSLNDSSRQEGYARLKYRIQAYSSAQKGKKAEARAIFSTADKAIKQLGFIRKTYATTPDLYESTGCEIIATYEAVISADGVIYGQE